MVHIPRPRCRKSGKNGKTVLGTQKQVIATDLGKSRTKVEESGRRRSASDSVWKTIGNGIGSVDADGQSQIAISRSCPIRVTTRFAQYRALKCEGFLDFDGGVAVIVRGAD